VGQFSIGESRRRWVKIRLALTASGRTITTRLLLIASVAAISEPMKPASNDGESVIFARQSAALSVIVQVFENNDRAVAERQASR
jgi:hypothetical protein